MKFSLLLFMLINCYTKSNPTNSAELSDVILRFNQRLSSDFKVVNGEIANLIDFPYAAFILADLGSLSYMCTGSLIAEGTILTAAHCLFTKYGEIPPSSMYVSIGSTSSILTNENFYRVIDSIPHPEYSNDTIVNDIGIVKFNQALSDYTPFAKIYSSDVSDSLPVAAAGWGVTSNSDTAMPSNLLISVPLKISSSDLCSYLYPLWTSNNDKLICTEILNGQSPCYGDSGGPLAYSDVSPMPIVGVISFGLSKPFNASSDERSDCGLTGATGYYTHAFNYIDWIAETSGIEKNSLLYNESASNDANIASVSNFSPIPTSFSSKISNNSPETSYSTNNSLPSSFNPIILSLTIVVSIIYHVYQMY
ncbi:Serine protease 52 [Smittium mucronatum]|uniref:Serine protease 52 n=1 Tax=Smittium mucronatum TaxID=133383 RepID=A0A1R0H6R2_9FUNG|nr:Serine protease 52 [Smittium mucronatum]